MINAAIRIPTPEEIKARRARLGFGPAKVNRTPKPAPVVNVVDEKQEWRKLASEFDDHVTRHRFVASGRWYVRYAQIRAVELGFKSFDDLNRDDRSRRYALGRQILVHEIRAKDDKVSYPELARFMGGRDHSTLVSGDRNIVRLGLPLALDMLKQLHKEANAPVYKPDGKLRPDEVRHIRTLQGKRHPLEIAKLYNVSCRSIYAVWRGETWKNVR